MGRHCTRLHRPERGQLPSRTLQHRHVLAQPLTRGRTEHQADCSYRLPIYSTPRNTMRHLANYPGRNRYGSTQPVGKGCTATQCRRAQRFTLQQSLDSRSRASHGKSSSSSKGRDQIPHHRLLRLSGIGYGDHWEVESSCDATQTLRASAAEHEAQPPGPRGDRTLRKAHGGPGLLQRLVRQILWHVPSRL